MCQFHDIRPVERECLCDAAASGRPHSRACEEAFRARFFGAWRTTRTAFGEAAADEQLREGLGGRAALN